MRCNKGSFLTEFGVRPNHWFHHSKILQILHRYGKEFYNEAAQSLLSTTLTLMPHYLLTENWLRGGHIACPISDNLLKTMPLYILMKTQLVNAQLANIPTNQPTRQRKLKTFQVVYRK